MNYCKGSDMITNKNWPKKSFKEIFFFKLCMISTAEKIMQFWAYLLKLELSHTRNYSSEWPIKKVHWEAVKCLPVCLL